MADVLPPPIVVDQVHKVFRLPRERISTLKERALHPFRRAGVDRLVALRDVSFAVDRGEFFGIVGRNGSGKSTLLKCIAGIYAVDRGAIYLNGRVSTFIELGVGFNPDLPARDNVILNGTMLGLSPRESRKRFDRIVDFAELHDFVDLKLKNYSSGMLVRLAFSVMIQVDAEILLIDEILAVGDAAFQQKCYEEFERLRRDGVTVLFVTHDMGAVQRFCDRALLLERGRVVDVGEPEAVANRYLELNFSEAARAAQAAAMAAKEGVEGQADGPAPTDETVLEAAALDEVDDPEPSPARRYGDGKAEITAIWLEDDRGGELDYIPIGKRCVVAMRVAVIEQLQNPLFGINVHNDHGDHLFSASNVFTDPRLGTFEPGEEVVVRIAFPAYLAPNRYHFTPAVAHQGGAWIDRRERLLSLPATGAARTDGLIDLPYEFALERLRAQEVAR